MGWWSEDIMGGDAPCDVELNFDDFVAQHQGPMTSKAILDAIDKTVAGWGYDPENHLIPQVFGFLSIANKYPIDDQLAERIIQGIDEELAEGCENWNEPQLRIDSLNTFKQVVLAYSKGEEVTLPHQRGLFDQIFNHLADKKEIDDEIFG